MYPGARRGSSSVETAIVAVRETFAEYANHTCSSRRNSKTSPRAGALGPYFVWTHRDPADCADAGVRRHEYARTRACRDGRAHSHGRHAVYSNQLWKNGKN